MQIWNSNQGDPDQSGASRLAPVSRWGGKVHHAVARIAEGRQQLRAAFELAYEKYLVHGYVNETPAKLIYRKEFGLETSRTFVALDPSNHVTGTLTIVGDHSTDSLQVESTYKQEVDALRLAGRNLAEVTCLAIEGHEIRESIDTFFALTRFMIHYSLWRGFDDLILTLHPKHQRFYSRCYPIERLGSQKSHQPARDNPAVLCRLNLRTIHSSVRGDVGASYKPIPTSQFVKPPISLPDHIYFCNLVGGCSSQHDALSGRSDKRAA